VPAKNSFDYAVVRVVPYVERGEFLNAGVILFCRTRRFLKAQIELDPTRLTALAPNFDPTPVAAHLDLIPRICVGGAEAGPLGEWSQAERFHWLVSPRSTIIQISPVHCGFCTDPDVALHSLFEKLVHPQ
jgi:hypothetical protein